MKKLKGLVILLIFAALVFVSCGGEGYHEPENPPTWIQGTWTSGAKTFIFTTMIFTYLHHQVLKNHLFHISLLKKD